MNQPGLSGAAWAGAAGADAAGADTARPEAARPARAVIDLQALRHNYVQARRQHGARVLAVLKADAYGHGATACAGALQGLADGYAVAFLDEARPLRQAGVAGPILVLEGAFSLEETVQAARLGCALVVHDHAQLGMLQAAERLGGPPVHVWLKIDTGMSRAGLPPGQAGQAHARLRALRCVAGITLMTHLASADEPASGQTAAQLACFDEATAGLPGPRSVANSAGILAWPGARRDWGRAGIMLYGAEPLPQPRAGLRPVMRLCSRVFAERTVPAGQPVGYGAGYVAPRPTRLGLVAMGYADGYPRRAPSGTPVAVDGRPAALAGRVSMDMLTVDLTDLPGCGVGSEVELWGAAVPVGAVAQAAGTIPYELLCNVKRVRRIYEGQDAPCAPAARRLQNA
ncbi:alanine racemase [Orrella sp. JC864]|uniref:alanine racemase n=1 Tax=Orrella sp. JC864 TaxID=3120298 RepID=UPI00300AF056